MTDYGSRYLLEKVIAKAVVLTVFPGIIIRTRKTSYPTVRVNRGSIGELCLWASDSGD